MQYKMPGYASVHTVKACYIQINFLYQDFVNAAPILNVFSRPNRDTQNKEVELKAAYYKQTKTIILL